MDKNEYLQAVGSDEEDHEIYCEYINRYIFMRSVNWEGKRKKVKFQLAFEFNK